MWNPIFGSVGLAGELEEEVEDRAWDSVRASERPRDFIVWTDWCQS